MNEEIEELNAGMHSMLAMHAGVTVVLSSLIATHPNFRQFQLHLVSALEVSLNRGFGSALTELQKSQVREYVESLQQLHEVRGEIRPIG